MHNFWERCKLARVASPSQDVRSRGIVGTGTNPSANPTASGRLKAPTIAIIGPASVACNARPRQAHLSAVN